MGSLPLELSSKCYQCDLCLKSSLLLLSYVMVSREVPSYDSLFMWYTQIFENEEKWIIPTKDYSLLVVLKDILPNICNKLLQFLHNIV